MISDPEFPQKYLRFCFSSNRFQLRDISHSSLPSNFSITSYPIHSVFSSIYIFTSSTSAEFEFPLFKQEKKFPLSIVGSCDGILCLADFATDLILMCNPSIRKINQLPLPLDFRTNIHTLGTRIWRRIVDFPFGFPDRIGVSLSRYVNWLASYDEDTTNPDSQCFIVSLDLGNECFQQLLLPNYGRTISPRLLSLSVQRDCLCLLADHDIWIMKEFGNQSSWNKLITIPSLKYHSASYGFNYGFNKLLYVSEDDKIVLGAYQLQGLQGDVLGYDSRNRLAKCHNTWSTLHLSIESLISP